MLGVPTLRRWRRPLDVRYRTEYEMSLPSADTHNEKPGTSVSWTSYILPVGFNAFKRRFVIFAFTGLVLLWGPILGPR